MMLPILEPSSPDARPHARDLGIAFQLTNFLRDVNEDLERGRVHLPQEDLRRFDADPRARRVNGPWRDLMRFEIERARGYYTSADIGVAYLPASSARCIRAARRLYAEILERIEAADYDVFTRRARVPGWRKALVVAQSVSVGQSG
jgi:15-cis-phytoene synthase